MSTLSVEGSVYSQLLCLVAGAMLVGCGASKDGVRTPKVAVNVVGEVKIPGSYAINAPVRLHDVVAAAGGYTTAAATNILLLTFRRPADAAGPARAWQSASGSDEAAYKIRWDQFDDYDLTAMREVSVVILTQEGWKTYGVP